jgi:hypothetical protein
MTKNWIFYAKHCILSICFHLKNKNKKDRRNSNQGVSRMLNEITSIDQFQKTKSSQDFFLLGFNADKSDSAKEAMQRLEQARELFDETPVYTVNASSVKEIHPLFGVNSVPTVLSIHKGEVTKNIQGL